MTIKSAVLRLKATAASKKQVPAKKTVLAADYKDSAEFTKDLNEVESSVHTADLIVSNAKFMKHIEALAKDSGDRTLIAKAKVLKGELKKVDDCMADLIEALEDIG
jgi:NADP-dependent 3-hydroxy acid dehydrogenase YdfG